MKGGKEVPKKQPVMPYTGESLPAQPSVLCRNCGRPVKLRRHNQQFCNKQCKNRWWSRGNRRLSQLEKRVVALSAVIRLLAQAVGTDVTSVYVDGEKIEF
jgi:endogenous inhibitor of DNA gyrase (YacG/DUF329 family)